jgi:uncharacterized integral membrane protein
MEINLKAEPSVLRRGPLLITALLAAVGGAAIYVFALFALMSSPPRLSTSSWRC